MQLQEYDLDIEEKNNQSFHSNDWHPAMGDYEKSNSAEDSRQFQKKRFKINLLIISLVIIQLVILAVSIFFFLP